MWKRLSTFEIIDICGSGQNTEWLWLCQRLRLEAARLDVHSPPGPMSGAIFQKLQEGVLKAQATRWLFKKINDDMMKIWEDAEKNRSLKDV